MRTQKIKILKFEELSKEAKRKAVENNEYQQGYFWDMDAIKSLRAGIEYFGAKLQDYSINFHEYGDRSTVKIEAPDNGKEDMPEFKDLLERAGSTTKKR